MAAGVAGVPVVPEAGSECEQASGDAGDQSGHGVRTVAFEGELAFGRADDRLDPLADAAAGPKRGRSSFRSERKKIAPNSAISAHAG